MKFELDLRALVEAGVSIESVIQDYIAPSVKAEYKKQEGVNVKYAKAVKAVSDGSYTYSDLDVLKERLDDVKRMEAARDRAKVAAKTYSDVNENANSDAIKQANAMRAQNKAITMPEWEDIIKALGL